MPRPSPSDTLESRQVFVVDLIKQEGKAFGLTITQSPRGETVVTSIAKDSAAWDFNERNPALAIYPGDKISSVNGVGANFNSIVGQFWKGGELSLVMIREHGKEMTRNDSCIFLAMYDVSLFSADKQVKCPIDCLARLPATECAATECAICLHDFTVDDRVVQLPCKHSFHPGCISQWMAFASSQRCPLCKSGLKDQAAVADA